MKNSLTNFSNYSYSINQIIKTLTVGVLGIYFLLTLSSSLSWRLITDSAYLHYIAYLINEHDFVLYKDIFEINMPGIHLFHMAIGKLFGYSDFAFRMVDTFWLLATLIVTWLIIKPLGGSAAFGSCFLFGSMYLQKGAYFGLQREFIALLPIAIAILIVTQNKFKFSFRVLNFLIGSLFSIAAMFKPHLIIGLPIIITYCSFNYSKDTESVKPIIVTNLKGVFFASIGFLIIFLLPFSWVWKIGGLDAFLETSSSFTPLYAKLSGDLNFHEAHKAIEYLLRKYIKFGGNPYSILLLTSIMGFYFVLKNLKDVKKKKLSFLLFLFVWVYSFYAVLGGKGWGYHYIPFIYFCCLCSGLLLFSTPTNERPKANYMIIFPTIIFALTFNQILHPTDRIINAALNPNYKKSLVEKTEKKYKSINELSNYLNKNLTDTDKVQTLDWIEGGVHAMLISKAVTPTPYICDFQFYINVSNPYIRKLRKNFMEGLEREKPMFIIKNDRKNIMSGVDVSYDFPELNDFINKYYTKDYEIDRFEIFRKNQKLDY